MAKANTIAERDLFNGIDMKEIAKVTEECSGADVAEIIRRTLEEKVRQEGSGETPTPVKTEDILDQISGYERTRQTRSQVLKIDPPYRPELN